MIGNITFDGVSSLDYGVYVTDMDSDNAPDRVYQIESVPGRNGSLVYSTKAFNNITVRYPAFVYEDLDSNIDAFRNYLASKEGYMRLEDSFHPDEFRLARYSSAFELNKTVDANMGSITLEFDCKPQRFLTSGETAVTLSGSTTILNPTLYPAKPIIRIYGTGTVGIGSVSITFDGSTSYVDIDCELQDAYYGSTNKNASITLLPNRFPELAAGSTGITLGTGITSVEITPRWWQI